MTMHITGPWLTNINTKKRHQKITKSQQEEIERGWRARNHRLKELGLPKQTIEEYKEWLYGRGKKEKKKTDNRAGTKKTAADKIVTENSARRSLDCWITGPVSSKPTPVYTGIKVKGIGTMHKSNAVPIFTDDEAIDISRMRR